MLSRSGREAMRVVCSPWALRGPQQASGLGAVLLLAFAAAAFAPGTAHAAMYKWVDDKGVIHYSDQIPPEAVNKGNVQLNKEGYTVKKVEPPKSAEDMKASEQEKARLREAAAKDKVEREMTNRRDRAVLDSYTTESDIDLAKSRSVKTIESALQSAQGYSAQLTKRKAALIARKEALAGKPVPADIERELASGDVELARQADLIALKQKELREVIARYDADKERWRALKAASDQAAAAGAPAAPTAAAAAAKTK